MASIISGGSTHVEPNLGRGVLSVSLVCESKAGFSMRQLMKTQMCGRIMKGLTSTPLCFLATAAVTFSRIWSTMYLTCVPPRVVAIELTKLTAWKPMLDRRTQTSHRSLMRMCVLGL